MAATNVDLTGSWTLLKTEGIDDFLTSMEMPWIKRKAAQVMLVSAQSRYHHQCP